MLCPSPPLIVGLFGKLIGPVDMPAVFDRLAIDPVQTALQFLKLMVLSLVGESHLAN